jgi:hypothetical protein
MRYSVLFSRFPASDRSSHPRCASALLYFAGWVVLASAAGACGSAVATSTVPSPVKCSVALTPPASPVNSAGSTATVGVTTQAECAWNASSEAGWITGLTPASGQGSAQLQIQVVANPDASARQGDIVVNDMRARITQDAAPCRYDLSSTHETMPAPGGNKRITVSAPTGCAWSARTEVPWIVISAGETATGSGAVIFAISANTSGNARRASVIVASQSVTIDQDAAPPNCGSSTVSPGTFSVSALATNGLSTSVTAPSGCEWSASSNASWISLTGRTTSTGTATVTFNVAPNVNGGPSRTGTLTVAGQTVTVNQAAAPCSYSVTPTTVSINAVGGAGTPISVTTGSGCTWTATTSAGWITILSGATGTGNGDVTYSVQANTGSARSGTLTVAGQTVPISQSAPCTYTISPTGQIVANSSGTGGPIAVMTQVGCTWAAVSKVSWITVTSGASGTGNGTVTFSVIANDSGGTRKGEILIAGSSFTVTQQQ